MRRASVSTSRLAPAGRCRDSTRGETLVELLISIAILGIAGAGVISVVMMGTAASVLHEEVTAADRLLRNWAEQLEHTSYVECATPSDVELPPEPGWSGTSRVFTKQIKGVTYTASVAHVLYWDKAKPGFTTDCPPDSGLQRFTLRMVVEGEGEGKGMDGTTEELLLTRRNPCRTVAEDGCS